MLIPMMAMTDSITMQIQERSALQIILIKRGTDSSTLYSFISQAIWPQSTASGSFLPCQATHRTVTESY